jgi:cytochrome b561
LVQPEATAVHKQLGLQVLLLVPTRVKQLLAQQQQQQLPMLLLILLALSSLRFTMAKPM